MIFYLIVIGLWIIFAVGYILNIIAIVHMINDPITGMLILRIIGIFAAPMGAILGLFF